MFYLILTIISSTVPYGNILTLYRDKTCQKCKDYEAILTARDINVNIVDCDDKNDCPSIPSFEYTNNQVKKAESTDLSILDLIVEELETLELKGPWLVIIYDEKELLMEKYLMKAALKFPELNVGKIHKSKVPNNFVSKIFPSLVALYNGISKVYKYSMDNSSFENFIKTLLESFKELTYKEFTKIDKNIFFVVFYQNEESVNHYFKPFAHKYKFIARFYKSKDPELLKVADIDFLKLRSPKSPVSDVLVLSVYKHRRFHKLIITQFNESAIDEWIFHSHYSQLTRVNTDNFYTIFHSFKPVILLLTRKEQLCEELERVSEEIHQSRPFVSYIFAVVDIDQMSGFIEALLPGLNVPNILVYDSSKYLYYVDDNKINNVDEYVKLLINKYEKGLLEAYPRMKKKRSMLFILFVFLTIVSILYALKCMLTNKVKLH